MGDLSLVIGTAGHIDHGKTSLVRALTGTETDRLPEEKSRGITIVLGFAQLSLGDGRTCSLIDVPGHERLVRTMVAGATGIDLGLLVVAADEGIMPQTREHMDILQLLGVDRLVVALNKCDLVDEEMVELARYEVEDELEGRGLTDMELVEVSAVTGAGIEELRTCLQRSLLAVPERQGSTAFRLPVDRCFNRPGFGVVVTGTAVSGVIEVGGEVSFLPEGGAARVRGLQVHGVAAERAVRGQRVALNLAGVERAQVERGTLLASRDSVAVSDVIDIWFTHLAGAVRGLKTGAPIRFLTGTSEVPGRLRLLGLPGEDEPDEAEPGWKGFAQLRLKEPAAVLPGDRVVIRAETPVETLGGGQVVDPLALRYRRRHRAAHLELLHALDASLPLADRLLALCNREPSEPLPLEQLSLRLGVPREAAKTAAEALEATDMLCRPAGSALAWFPSTHADQRAEQIISAVEAHVREHTLDPGAPSESVRTGLSPAPERSVFLVVVGRMSAAGVLEQDGAWLRPPGWNPTPTSEESAWLEALTALLEAAGNHPPPPSEAASGLGIPASRLPVLLAYLQRREQVVRIREDFQMGGKAWGQLRTAVMAHLAESGELSPQAFKEISGLTRRHSIPLLEFFDQQRLTVRRGSVRIRHPLADGG